MKEVLDNQSLIYNNLQAARAQAWLAPLVDGWAYLPVTNWSAGPTYYMHVCNDIIINQRVNIVEMGSGISTVLIARLLERNRIPARVYSVDQDASWQRVVKGMLAADNIERHVSFLQADIVLPTEGTAPPWYNAEQLSELLRMDPIDMLLVDGPKVQSHVCIRHGAVPFLHTRLAAKACVFLHDTDRQGEQTIVGVWKNLLHDFKLEPFARHACFVRGESHASLPQTAI